MAGLESEPKEKPDNHSGGNRRLNISLSPWFVVGLLLVVICAMLALWRPWQESFGPDSRTVEVTGTATLKAEPDEFVFSPTYQFKGQGQSAVLSEMTAKSEGVVKGLKNLGVQDSQIKTNSSGYEDGPYIPIVSAEGDTTYSLNLTVTTDSREMAEKIQNYLLDTEPLGSVSPYAGFSEKKRKELETQARDEATKDARSKADQSAQNLGFKVAAVKTVNDGAGFGGPVPLYGRDMAVGSSGQEVAELSLQPGENELSYSVTVVYFIR